MGSFLGHVIPGIFFILFALWWSLMTPLKYLKIRKVINGRVKINIKYKTSPTMACICCSSVLQKYPIESIVKLVFALIGMLIEGPTGFKFNNSNPSSWYYMATHAQHLTMYAAFLIDAIVEILVHFKVNLPSKIDFVCGIFAYSCEGLLFQFHLHGKDQLDAHLHILLVIAIYACALSTILELINPYNVLFTYGRILFTFLQGTWFLQIAFVLYPPIKALEGQWDPKNDQHIMFITTIFVWHFFIIFMLLLIEFIAIDKLCDNKYLVLENEDSDFELNKNCKYQVGTRLNTYKSIRYIDEVESRQKF